MALWNEPSRKEPAPNTPAAEPIRETDRPLAAVPPAAAPAANREAASAARAGNQKESLISSDLTIEGKIEGSGHVRIAGRFKGDIQVQGNVTIEQGANVTGEVKADMVIIGGELNGNIDAASRVELLATGVLNGDLKGGSLTVAAGSRMRGRAEFGWAEKGK